MKLLLDNSWSLVMSVAITLLFGLSSLSSHQVRASLPTIVAEESPTIVATPETTTATITTTTISALFLIENCKHAGFDPLQLACTTCTLLPKKHQSKCEDCCQSYKTLEKQSKRYEVAILVNTGFPEAVQELLKEDKDKVKNPPKL